MPLFGRKEGRNSLTSTWFNMLSDNLCCVSLLRDRIGGGGDELVYMVVRTFQVSFERNLRPLGSTSPKPLLIDTFLLVGVSQGKAGPRLSLAALLCQALRQRQGLQPREQRASIQSPAARKLVACDPLWRLSCPAAELVIFCNF